MRIRISLFWKILFWLGVNLVVLGIALPVLFNLQFHLSPNARLAGDYGDRIDAVARLIAAEIEGKNQIERDAVLQRYRDAYRVEFYLYTNTGMILAGPVDPLPPKVMLEIKRPAPAPPPRPPRNGEPPPAPRHPIFTVTTADPTRYWVGIRMPLGDPSQAPPVRATLLAASESMSGHGLFFDPKPWAIIIVVVFGISVLVWLPFVHGLTRSIRQMTAATEEIAEERFAVRVDQSRSDELGRLSAAINHLAARLSGFVTGQKRFLGDIAHELNSPLGRMQFALGILEQRVTPADRDYVADVQEEVQTMSRLVSELLTFAKAGIRSAELILEPVSLHPLAVRTVAQEAADTQTPVHIEIGDTVTVLAQPELLARALGNLIRNALRYAGAGGPIFITATQTGSQVRVVVRDNGPGVPESEVGRLFDPFYRLERDRARQTGGAGLGLAIVKSCVEACRGTVTAKNLSPFGFEVTITLQAVK